MTRRCARTLHSVLLAFGLLSAALAEAATTTYRWVDEKGNVHYSDAMPSQQAGMGHAELDKEGRVIRQAPRTRFSAEELRRQQEEAKRRAAEKQAREARERADRALLSTYTREDEIDLARDRAVELERLSLAGLQVRLDRATQRLAEINADIERLRQVSRKPPPPYMSTLKQDAQKEVVRMSEQILKRSKDIEDIRSRYDMDKARWRELKGLQAAGGQR